MLPPLLLPLLLSLLPPGPPATAAPGVGVTPVVVHPAGGWLPPVGGSPVVVVHRFAAPPGPYAAGHRGVDLQAVVDEVVRAPADGRVVFAGQVAGRPIVVLVHAGGVRTTYEPVTASVPVGGSVRAGQPIGSLVATGSHCLPAACLHWGARTGQGAAVRYLDPMALLAGQGPVRLLPLDGRREGALPGSAS